MGGRGTASGLNKHFHEFEPTKYGQITRYEAGQLYKAVKNGKINAYPETISMLYEESERSIRFASERYSQDHRFYDNIYEMTRYLINSDYKKSQKIINEIQNDLVKRSGKKSRFYKYKKPGL